MLCDEEVARHGTITSLEKVTKLFQMEESWHSASKSRREWLLANIFPSSGKFKGEFIQAREEHACLTSRGQSAPPWLRIRILGADSPSCSLHSRDCNHIPLLGTQVVVLGACCPLPGCWQSLQLLPPTAVDTAESSQAKGI